MSGTLSSRFSELFRMSDEVWSRHANPWSVFTRLAAVPALILAVWSRVWIGGWSLIPVGLAILWLWLNPRVFPPVPASRGWASRGIYGEKLWADDRATVSEEAGTLLRRLIGLGLLGFLLIAWGLWRLQPWPAAFGGVLVVVAQLWRIDRMGFLYEARSGRTITLPPVGVVRSSLEAKEDAPRQGSEGGVDARIEIDPAYFDALEGLRTGDDVFLLTWLHEADRTTLRVHPRDDPENPVTGVFATRSPDRPNPIGLHRVRVLSASGTGRLHVNPLEAIDGTPVLDIKPVWRDDVPGEILQP